MLGRRKHASNSRRWMTLKNATWLSAGVFVSMLQFEVATALAGAGVPVNQWFAASYFVVAALVGGIFCVKKATHGDSMLLGTVIALALPAFHVLLWVSALAQDMLRKQSLPGDSLTVMIALPSTVTTMLVMGLTGLCFAAGGRAVVALKS